MIYTQSCPECDRLRAAMERLQALMHAAKEAVRARMETASTEEYRALSAAKSQAWLEYDTASREFDKHLMIHAADSQSID